MRKAFMDRYLGMLLAILTASLSVAFSAPASSLKALLEVDREAYYAGDPVSVRLSIWNDAAAAADAPGGDPLAGFELYDADGKKLAQAAAAAGADEKAQPGPPPAARTLGAGAFYGIARDIAAVYPRLRQAGTYRLQWVSPSLASNALILRIVPRYDPDKDYSARIETDLGPFTLEFLRKDAPIAVKTFIELAQTGFYDGVTFHYAEADRVAASGDPTGTGQGGPGFSIPHERPQVKMLAGTVIMMAAGRPPANGSIFAILLAPRPDFEGTATGFAQVVEGLDVVHKISQVPTSPKDAPQPHKPLKPVRIGRIVIAPKTP